MHNCMLLTSASKWWAGQRCSGRAGSNEQAHCDGLSQTFLHTMRDVRTVPAIVTSGEWCRTCCRQAAGFWHCALTAAPGALPSVSYYKCTWRDQPWHCCWRRSVWGVRPRGSAVSTWASLSMLAADPEPERNAETLLQCAAGLAAAPAAAQPPVRRWPPTAAVLPPARSVDWNRAGYRGACALQACVAWVFASSPSWPGSTLVAAKHATCDCVLLSPADGDAPLPVPSAMYDVRKDFGAKGDGKADDTKALQV